MRAPSRRMLRLPDENDAMVTLKLKTTASLLAALASSPLAGCSASSDETPDPNPSGGGATEAEERPLAPLTEPEDGFLEAYSETNRFRLGHPRSFQILPDGTGLFFLRSGARSRVGRLFFFDATAGEEREFLNAETLLGSAEEEELSAEEAARRERMRLTASGIASYRLSRDGDKLLVPLSGRLFLVDRATVGEEGGIRELESEAGGAIDPQFSPDGSHIATVREGDLYVIDAATGAEMRLTTRRGPEIQNGLAEFVAQEEMSRMRGFWWSPDGQSIAYQETDHAGMERMHILDPMHPESEPRAWPYPRPGEANASVRLGIIPISGGETRWVEWERERFPYLCSVVWPTEGPLTVLVQDREQEHESLRTVDPADGSTQELLAEEDAAWINLDQTVPRWLPGGEEFLWSSERTGEWRLEVRAADGTLARTITPEGFGYRGLAAVDEEAGVAWVTASAEPTETHVYRVNLDGEGEPSRLSEERGEHAAHVGRDGSLWVHERRTGDGTIVAAVRNAEGAELETLVSEVEALPFRPNVTHETVGRREWRTVVTRPRNFDESLRYPVILYVYGGPHARLVSASPRGYLLSQWQADHGYIVVTIDGRGTPARGREWERTIDGDFISAPLEDQVEALQQLGDLHPEMDLERVGVWGWSFGGYFSAMAVLRRPDIFRVGVAGAPVSEWRDYDTHYTERYLGLPEEADTEGLYHASSVLTYAAEEVEPEDLRPLLVIHGTADDNVYFSHALKLQNTLFRSGRPVDLVALSGLTHMVPEPTVMSRMHARIMAYFEAHLRGE